MLLPQEESKERERRVYYDVSVHKYCAPNKYNDDNASYSDTLLISGKDLDIYLSKGRYDEYKKRGLAKPYAFPVFASILFLVTGRFSNFSYECLN